jgi:hypothetical protein
VLTVIVIVQFFLIIVCGQMLPANLSDIIPNASLEAIDLIMVSIDVDMTS